MRRRPTRPISHPKQRRDREEEARWLEKVQAMVSAYVARGIPERAAVQAGLRDLEGRGVGTVASARPALAWLRDRLRQLAVPQTPP